MGKIFTTTSLAEKWQCSDATVRAIIKRGELNAFRAGGWRIKLEDVEKYECRTGGSDDSRDDGSSCGKKKTVAGDVTVLRPIRAMRQREKRAR